MELASRPDNLGDFWELYEYNPYSPSGFISKKTQQKAGGKHKTGWMMTYHINGKRRMVMAHKVIWSMFNGMPIPPRCFITSIDGDRLNVHPSNLQLETVYRSRQKSSRNRYGITKKSNTLWELRMCINDKRHSFCFPSEEHAMRFKAIILGKEGQDYLDRYTRGEITL